MPRQAVAAAATISMLIGLPSCSLLVDMNPDGIIDRGGTAGKGGKSGVSGMAGSGGGTAASNVASAGGGNASLGNLAGGTGGATIAASASGGSLGIAGGSSADVSTGGLASATSAVTMTGGMSAASGASATGGTSAASGAVATAGATATGGASNTATSTGGAAPSECPGTGGPTMVKLPQGFCIDSTEVTRAQYTAWLNTIRPETITGQDPATCAWNTGLAPVDYCMTGPEVCQGLDCGNHPQVCVDWCDAVAYCRGVGKRLCGRIGGGTNPYAEYGNPTMSQWYSACSSVGANSYPYGYLPVKTACNGRDFWGEGSPTTTAAGSLSSCQAVAPYAGVFDMSGNVREWEDSCGKAEGHESETCYRRGASFDNGFYAGYLACVNTFGAAARDVADVYTGFRCCGP